MLKDFTKETFDILIQAGQSNSEGYGFGNIENPYNPNNNVYYLTPDFIIEHATERVTGNQIQSNFGLSFAQEYIDAGMLEENETMEECIKRELYEETGLNVAKIKCIMKPSYSAVGISDIKTQIAFVEACGKFSDHTSENELIDAAFYTADEVKTLLETEEFSSRAQMAAYHFVQMQELK